MGYAGLPRETFKFLKGLEANNDKGWFEAHRGEYQRFWLAAGLDLVAALSGEAAEIGLLAVPKLNASLRRIHRDVRFSKDKSPYQPWLHLILSSGSEVNKVPGVHVVFTPRGWVIARGNMGWSRGRWRRCGTGSAMRQSAGG